MTTSSPTVSVPPRLHPSSMIRRSAVLVLVLGMSIVAVSVVFTYPFAYSIPLAGIVAGALAFTFFKGRYLYGRPTSLQSIAISVTLVLGVILLIGLFVFLPDYASRTFLLGMLLVIGIVFIPLGIASGPLMLLLASLCILNALLGLWLQGLSLTIFAGIDGLLKIIFGILMLSARPVHPDTERGVRPSP